MRDKIKVKSPGRINLIGEHVDYNGGYVLPAAVDLSIDMTLKPLENNIGKVISLNYNDQFEFDVYNIQKSEVEWQNYILGVVHHLLERKPNSVRGFQCEIKSNLPMGSGLSSSAALECGIASGLNELFEIGLTDEEIITLSRAAEHDFVGTKCGVMDQFAVVKGNRDSFILLNCQNLEYEYIPAEISPYQLILLNTNVSHNLASSAYNERFEQCMSALKQVQSQFPEYEFLADVAKEDLKKFEQVMDPLIFQRAMYVIKENNRVKEAAKALASGEVVRLGQLLYEAHYGQQYEYEISCRELDFLVEFSKQFDPVLGARMMGGGFGGCTINLVHQDFIDEYIKKASAAYKNEFKIDLTPVKIQIEDGVTNKTQYA